MQGTPYNPTNYIKFLVEDKIKAEYMWQYQYHPEMKAHPFKALTVEKDPEYQKKFDELIPAFLMDMDEMLKMIGIKYGQQWSRLAIKESEGVA